jgi:glyoxylase-like metal-dependent hydrolase (beta-lactamase superfamily II)
MRTRTGNPKVGVKVRMYRYGLGDCFLLTFTRAGKDQHLLVDCGIGHLTPDGRAIIRKVMHRVAEDTRDTQHPAGHIHCLIVSHEHWDHVIGFLGDGQEDEQDPFAGMKVDHVVLSWAEDPNDPDAKALLKRWKKKAKVLQELAAKPEMQGLRVARVIETALGASGGAGLAGAMSAVRKKVGEPDYLDWGEVVELPGVEGVRAYVLGPPRDQKRIGYEGKSEEMYAPGLALESSLLTAMVGVLGLDAGEDQEALETERELTYPFAKAQRRPLPTATEAPPKANRQQSREDRFFATHYSAKGQAWRRIDWDWLDPAGALAIALRVHMNNTSLALALEVVDTGQILLFPGDAEVGNWKSWDDANWPAEQLQGEDGRALVDRLLGRTVLYKVGHHGSRNATPISGLARMTSRDLVAMGPIDANGAEVHSYTGMPSTDLLEAIRQRTRGRLLSADECLDLSQWERPEALSEREWSAFKEAVTAEEWASPNVGYVEYKVQ